MIVLCLDEMGPISAKSYQGKELINFRAEPPLPCVRATQQIDYGLRGAGYVFGVLRPVGGETYTQSYERRNSSSYVDFLHEVDVWVKQMWPVAQKVIAIVDNLRMHRSLEVRLFSFMRPYWEFLFQPKAAAYLNLIEPWWKVLRSLGLKGKRFETWAQVCSAVRAATVYWNAHRHPFVWGRRRRHRHCCHHSLGLALPAIVA